MARANPPGFFHHIAGAATTLVKGGAGVLERVVNNKKVLSGVITVYDGVDATGAVIAIITNPATLLDNAQTLEYGVKFTTGLCVVTSAADDLTVVHSNG